MTHRIFSSKSENKKLHDWWTKLLWSTSQKWYESDDNIKKTATGQRDDYITRILLDYLYFNEHCKLIGIE